jgi:hypothetical protein
LVRILLLTMQLKVFKQHDFAIDDIAGSVWADPGPDPAVDDVAGGVQADPGYDLAVDDVIGGIHASSWS